jgi:type II secretory pathway predicted ATPase ExeA/septal ring-binding cell division protein DamX
LCGFGQKRKPPFMTMYLEHFGLREAPFKITPHTEFFFAGANRGETLEALIYAITSGEGIVKVTGEVGAGKTMLCRVLMERLPKSVETIYFAVPSLSPDELLATVANDLGVESDGTNITKLIRALQVRLIEIYANGKRVVALIDEAHAMPVETLEQIRLLSNLETSREKLIQIVLFGQPELDQHLSMPNIRQLKERITHSFYLLPLPAGDIKDYLNFRLRAAGYHGPDLFSAESLKLITEASEGLTRRINIYADKTLLAAYAAGTHTITPAHVQAAITDTQIVLPAPKTNRKKILLAVATSLLMGAAIGFAVSQYSLRTTGNPSPTAANAATGIVRTASPQGPEIPKVANAVVVPATEVKQSAPEAAPQTATVAATIPANAEAPSAANYIPPAPKDLSKSSPAVASPVIAIAAIAPAENPRKANDADWLGKRMAADAARIATLPKAHYAIQLMTADQRQYLALDTYLRATGSELNPDLVWWLPTGSPENPRVTVFYGNFDGANAAGAGIIALPARLSKFGPYIRSFGAVLNDVRRGI